MLGCFWNVAACERDIAEIAEHVGDESLIADLTSGRKSLSEVRGGALEVAVEKQRPAQVGMTDGEPPAVTKLGERRLRARELINATPISLDQSDKGQVCGRSCDPAAVLHLSREPQAFLLKALGRHQVAALELEHPLTVQRLPQD